MILVLPLLNGKIWYTKVYIGIPREVIKLARVCEDWFPITPDRDYNAGDKQGHSQPGFYMDDVLKSQLDILIKNITDDWDFTIIVSGGGEVRLGKSMLAMQIGAYWSYMMWKVHKRKVPFDADTNFIFNWDKLIETGNKLGNDYKYCALVYDEAGESLQGSKVLTSETKTVLDYLRECGQYNFLNILVLPEFFGLPSTIAITRSIFLIDVSYRADKEGFFQRGEFKFYSRRQKKKLYLNGKRFLNYSAAAYNFLGRFQRFYPINERKYKEKKKLALIGRESNIDKNRHRIQRDYLFHWIKELTKLSDLNISAELVKRYNLKINQLTIRLARENAEKAIHDEILVQNKINELEKAQNTIPDEEIKQNKEIVV